MMYNLHCFVCKDSSPVYHLTDRWQNWQYLSWGKYYLFCDLSRIKMFDSEVGLLYALTPAPHPPSTIRQYGGMDRTNWSLHNSVCNKTLCKIIFTYNGIWTRRYMYIRTDNRKTSHTGRSSGRQRLMEMTTTCTPHYSRLRTACSKQHWDKQVHMYLTDQQTVTTGP